jgi:hypothetical protein
MTTNEGAPERVWIIPAIDGWDGGRVEYVRADTVTPNEVVEGLVEALRGITTTDRAIVEFGFLDKGIGTATPEGRRWLVARAALSRYEATRKTRGTDEQR